MTKKTIQGIFLGIILLLMYLPILILAVYSFMDWKIWKFYFEKLYLSVSF